MLCELISHVEEEFSTYEVKMTLFDYISHPIKTHVEGFGEFLVN